MIFDLIRSFVFCVVNFVVMTCIVDVQVYASVFYPQDHQHKRIAIRHIEGGGIGYNKGYTTFEGFLASDPERWKVTPFVDMRGHIFDNGKIAVNAGGGLRAVARDRVYGGNVYYDFRNTSKGHYNQMGLGLETLGKRWDVRVNGYLPFKKTVSCPYNLEFAGFQENQMMILQQYQLAMRGFNAELGVHCGTTKWVDFYAAAGPYYFSGKDIGCKFWGGKARLVARIKENWILELSNSYDKVFHDRFQCQLTFNWPFGSGSEEKDDDSYGVSDQLYARMMQPVDRQEIIVEEICTQRTAAINPSTCEPYRFVFVNNKSNSLGTYESPYPTLLQAQQNSVAGDIIYVFPGDGTTKGMNEGIVLKLDQKFWGSAMPHSLQTTQGNFVIPAQSTTAPKMTSTQSYGVTLAAANEVSGFTITDTYDHGIYGTNLSNVEISNCTINNSTFGDQIHLEYSSSHGFANLYDLTLTNGTVQGISIDSTAPYFTGIIKNSVIQNNGVYTIQTTLSNQANLSIVGNTMDHNVNGTNFVFNGPASLLMSGNTITNTGHKDGSDSAFPVLISAGTNSLDATITNNIIRDNGIGAIQIVLNATDSARLMISQNRIINNNSGSAGSPGSAIYIDLASSTTGNCYLNLLNNTISDNNKSALYCSNGSFNQFQVNAAHNTVTDNNGSGFALAVGANKFTLTATDNIISNGTDNGISTSSDLITTADITITNNQITGIIESF